MFQREYVVRVSPFQSVAAAAAGAVTEAEPSRAQYAPGPGFATLQWGDERYEFNGRLQRAALAVLYSAFEEGTLDVPEQLVMREIESDSSELRLLFRGHPAWGSLIQRSSLHGGPIGCFRLVRDVAA